jgi:hypothetical protein
VRNPNTLFVIGAGASKEAGMPTGKELIDIIAGKLNYRLESGVLRSGEGDADILDVLQQQTETREGIMALLEAAWRIRDGIIYSKSIDSFMDVHRHDERIQLCGKLAIVKSILEAERKSMLFVDSDTGKFQNTNDLKNTWLFDFAKNLNDGVPKSEISRIFEKVTFVVFNYDRCFEHFMFHALQELYGIDEPAASEVMQGLNVIHPYGTIGELPWQSAEGIPFGFVANRANMEHMARRIKTYTEQIEKSEALGSLKTAVFKADTLVFLGFSYHPENMKLLTIDARGDTERVFGTAKGISAADIAIIQGQLRKMIGGKPLDVGGRGPESEQMFIKDETCAALLQEFSRSLFATGRAGR